MYQGPPPGPHQGDPHGQPVHPQQPQQPWINSAPHSGPASGSGLPHPAAHPPGVPPPMPGAMPFYQGVPPPGPPPPGPAPFPNPAQGYQGGYVPQQPQHPMQPGPQQYAQQQYHPGAYQQQPGHYMPQQPGPGAPAGADPVAAAAQSFGINPLGIMAAGSLFGNSQQWGQKYVESMQQRVGAFTGGALHFHFAIDNKYVRSKLLMLLAPFLKRWTYTRVPEQMQGGAAFKPPKVDVNSPDLYIPLAAVWTYTLLVDCCRAAKGSFKPDGVYPLVWSACMAWVAHLLVAKLILRAMALPASVPWVELAAYTGYTFVPVCAAILLGQLAGSWAYYGAWLYGSTCMAIFLVRTMKRVIFQEARGYGRDLTLTNYLLLGLALFQYPFAFYLGVRP